ncbi:MAG TPA: double zinc ribbon domain-containing protein [Gaiellaceae bacterium]|jgi:predicted amidophosphoribosyltransferase
MAGPSLLDLLLPQRCLACGSPGAQVCPRCLAALPRIVPPLCARCGAPTAWPVERCRECAGRRLAFAAARAALAYDRQVRLLVAGWKEQGLRGLAPLAGELVAATVRRPGVSVLAFVPPDPDRRLKRGHHPPERLARELGLRWQLPVEPLLERARRISQQRGLARDQRRRNAAGAFVARGRVPARVALVDDVYTSGATAAAASSALRAAGARHVEVVTLARAIRLA